MSYVFAAPGQVVLPVQGTNDVFPVRRVYCVGRNYAEHAREMGHSERESPLFFAKPADAVLAVAEGVVARLPYPGQTADLQPEVELVLALGPCPAGLPGAGGSVRIWGYAAGIDLTRRDLQAQMKRSARPWEIGKAFDRSAPMAPIRRSLPGAEPRQARIWLDVNGERRQDGNIAGMIWNAEEILGHLAKYFTLAPGDLIFTGTPAGVGAVVAGDVVRAGIEGVGELALRIGPPQ